MDREWLYKQLDELSRLMDVSVDLVERLTDRVASLEECARLAPTKAVRRSRNKPEVPCVTPDPF